MKVYPSKLKERSELNLRQGIKSSLPDMKALFASVFTLYKISSNCSIDYSKLNGDTIELREDLVSDMLKFYSSQIKVSDITQSNFLDSFNNTPIFKSQLEALQVGIQLFWKLGNISFVDSQPSSIERKGGIRFNKKIIFSTNLDIINMVLSNDSGEIGELEKNLLFNYITKKSLIIGDKAKDLVRLLTIFSEETQYKIRIKDEEIFFQQEGIYSEIVKGETVESNDSHEQVGPFRLLKSAVKDGLNYYLQESRSNGFLLREGIDKNELSDYYLKVDSYLNLNPKRINYISDIIDDTEIIQKKDLKFKNVIYYGAPGTGKSFKVNELIKGKSERTIRVTFHPEYDYTSFIGGYKPTMRGDSIRYEFVPQAFINIYVKAWKDIENDYYLVIEEINRGNCSEIFGDIFQLLDRSNNYEVTPSKELEEYLNEEFKSRPELKTNKLLLPPNLTIIATMNTSDQSLFPMDSAFKRRWDWEFIPIDYTNLETNQSSKFRVRLSDSESFSWLEFIKSVNNIIKNNDNLGMDKCIGNYFIHPDSGYYIDVAIFINKALFYLWNDVFKDESDENTIFKNKRKYEDFFPIDPQGIEQLKELLEFLNVKLDK